MFAVMVVLAVLVAPSVGVAAFRTGLVAGRQQALKQAGWL